MPLIIGVLAMVLFSMPKARSQVGIKAGFGISDIVFANEGQTRYLGYEVNYLEHRKPAFSYQLGAIGNLGNWKYFDLQPELLFVLQGLNYNTSYLYDDIIYQLRLSYLQLPILMRLKTMPEKRSHLFFSFGPYLSIKLKANLITEFDGYRMKVAMENVKPVDFGVVLGLGFDTDLENGQFVFDLRTSYSLMNMMRPLEDSVLEYPGPDAERAKNISIALSVGYRFMEFLSRKKTNE